MDAYRDLLSNIIVDMKEPEGYFSDTVLAEYNIFRILGITKKEVIMCRFLADLLNPEGQHNCRILFLKSFMENVLRKTGLNDTLLSHTDVSNEVVTDDKRRIDIVIENARFLIPIEVKIEAGEQEGQCYDYYSYARQYDENTQIVYLTQCGDPPSEYSRKQKGGTGMVPEDKIICISWERDIYGWLAGLLAEIKNPVAKSAVMQYMDAIDDFTDRKETGIMERTLEILLESAAFFRAGIQIEEFMEAAKVKLIRLVFDAFRKEMDKIAPAYGLELETETNYYFYDNKEHEEFYNANSTYPGLNYVVKNAEFQNNALQMWFRIEVEHNLYAGFILFDTKADSEDGQNNGDEVDEITDTLVAEASRYLDRDIITPSDWWLAWSYPNGKRQDAYYTDVPDFMHMNPCAMELADCQKRTEYVKHAVKVFEEHLLKYLLHV